MSFKLSKWAFLLCGVAAILGIAIAGVAAESLAAQSPAAPKLAEDQFKNIKVLKGVPADQIIPTMQFIAASLGVECEYCHVRGDHGLAFDKDDKKTKLTARKMMQMMFAINKDNFENHREVTCYSCHRGSPTPLGIPLVVQEGSKNAPEESASSGEPKPSLPSADQLLEKYLAAIGGSDALKKISTRVETGKLTTSGGRQLPIDVYSKAPDERVSVMHFPNGDSITAFNGKEGWLSLPGRTHMMSASENDAARIDADMYLASHLKTLYKKFVVEPGEKIDAHDTYLVIGRNEGQPPLRLYFDRETGLLLRLVRYADTALGLNPTEVDYADYRTADGVKLPFRWTLARPGNRFTIQIDEISQNVPIDDAKFAPPPMPPPPDQKPAGH